MNTVRARCTAGCISAITVGYALSPLPVARSCAGEARTIAAGRSRGRCVHRVAHGPHNLGGVRGAEDGAAGHDDVGTSLRRLVWHSWCL